MTAEDLETKLREALPIGSSRSSVESVLANFGLEYSYDPHSKTLFAIARKLPNDNSVIRKSLTLEFRLDDDLLLKEVNSKIVFTGP